MEKIAFVLNFLYWVLSGLAQLDSNAEEAIKSYEHYKKRVAKKARKRSK